MGVAISKALRINIYNVSSMKIRLKAFFILKISVEFIIAINV